MTQGTPPSRRSGHFALALLVVLLGAFFVLLVTHDDDGRLAEHRGEERVVVDDETSEQAASRPPAQVPLGVPREERNAESEKAEAGSHEQPIAGAADRLEDPHLPVARDVRNATNRLATFAKYQTAILFCTLLLVGWTLYATRETLRLTRDSLTQTETATAAARETVEIARESERAHLFVEFNAAEMEVAEGQDPALQVTARIVNHGRTPAREVTAMSRVEFDAGDVVDHDAPRLALGAGKPFVLTFEKVLVGELHRRAWRLDGVMPYYVTVTVTYATVFFPKKREKPVIATIAFVPSRWTDSAKEFGCEWESYEGEYRDPPLRAESEAEHKAWGAARQEALERAARTGEPYDGPGWGDEVGARDEI